MTSYETATLAASVGQLAIGVGQIAVVWYGIGRMVQANEGRGKAQVAMMAQQVSMMTKQDENSQRRHDEAMTALKALIERTGLRAEG